MVMDKLFSLPKESYAKKILVIILCFCGFFNLIEAAENPIDIKITSEIKKNGTVGEALTFTVKLVSNIQNISDVRILNSPDLPLSCKIIDGRVLEKWPEKEIKNGKTYFSWIIERKFLTFEEAGKYKIGTADYVVLIPKVSEYYDKVWGFGKTVTYEEIRVSSPAVEIKIGALPENRQFSSFTNCIGDYKIEAWFPPGNISLDGEALVVFTINGFGDLSDIKLPNLVKGFGEGCRLKEVEQSEKIIQEDGRLYSEITLTCRFIPTSNEFIINPLCLVFFDPQKKNYYEICSESLHWTIKNRPKINDSGKAIEI